MRMNDIGSIPLLFVNKQVYEELSSLIYSRVDSVCIGGYILQYRNEDPSARWNCAYSLVRKQPNLQKFTREVTIRLPSAREDLLRAHWKSLGFKSPENRSICDAWVLIPDLEEFLRQFKSLRSLKIVVTVESREPPDFERLLSLYDICGKGTTIVFSAPTPVWDLWTADWASAWNNCLLGSERS